MIAKSLIIIAVTILTVSFVNAGDAPTEIGKVYVKAENDKLFKDADYTKKVFEQELNLDNKEFSTFMKNEFNKSIFYPGRIMSKICNYTPIKGIMWLTNEFDNFNEVGKCNFYGAVCRLNYTEIKQVLFLLLDDKTVIPHMGEPSPFRAMNDRVCDFVYNQLIDSIYEASGEKETLFSPQNSIDPGTKLEARDKAISTMKEWWKDHSEEFLKTQPSLVEKYPELKDTIEELKNKIKRQIEKQKTK